MQERSKQYHSSQTDLPRTCVCNSGAEHGDGRLRTLRGVMLTETARPQRVRCVVEICTLNC
ncbi:uncharacterized protein B0I36DRAFT_322020 [Microdochium trichocladiopsis]|uniref:Uncharacterized protein n=1 Tax=Microdochium trichocladiopsis TaxID=1682393 RepID=A0A9P8Y3M8_9PEZI|nr:uncharacterized protein B0I36DRAFT_340332 [Microdochium trichocladiopsis]XP_046012227.1 uncharacterized protein B0I36DRAFT_322020 [Microdochium trichocladiopsis]KAH7012754.1 hypothetical protein B0I36DRAFT_340332 [Microdochium trichocladiopsis]KAH7030547.1 hypothetical protein B0I36DRAFT_322020 [Microdochium trichocladiopsis]